MRLKNALKVVTSRLSSQPAPVSEAQPVRSMLRRKGPTQQPHPKPGAIAQGRYRIEAPIGTGASGIIYGAWQSQPQRRVALKMLRPQYEHDAQMAQRLLHEATMASAVRNEHVVEILESGQTESGKAFVVMEHIDGLRLSDLLDQNGALELPIVINIAVQIAEALRATHHAGIYHGDVKPDNLLVCSRPDNGHFVKLIDFGVAGDIEPTHTYQRNSMVCGTPTYMSPEQASGETLDGRTDFYSLGVVLYEMLSGTTPIRGSYPRELLIRHRTMAPLPLRSNPRCAHVPPRVEAIVHRCLEKDPSRRYQSATDLLRELTFVQGRLAAKEQAAIASVTPLAAVPSTAVPPAAVPAVAARASFAGLPKLANFSAAVPANDPGRPLTALPLPASQLKLGSVITASATPSVPAPPSRVRKTAPTWAVTTRESRRPGRLTTKWSRRAAPMLMLGVALGYVWASAFTQLLEGGSPPHLFGLIKSR